MPSAAQPRTTRSTQTAAPASPPRLPAALTAPLPTLRSDDSGAFSAPEPTPAVAARVRDTRPPAPPQDGAGTTEVHIHIGRIELGLPAASTAPRRRDSAARQPQSLDDYLRGKRRPVRP
jgi:hypothetical protein